MRNISLTTWNWQQPDWPHFTYEARRFESQEASFMKQGGTLIGAFKHLQPIQENELLAETATSEAMTTSAIEGEVLDRQSVRSSILRQLGIETEPRHVGPREEGIAKMMLGLILGSKVALTQERLCEWHELIMKGRSDLQVIGGYRTHEEPMQIVSGPIGNEIVHFEAPPSARVHLEMKRFFEWFNQSERQLPPLARSGIAHLHFESIHPFEDGNGRIGRAISEIALAQGLGQRSLTMLATEIESRKKEYYAELERASRTLEATEWLEWFADVVLAAQRRTIDWIEFVIAKTRMMDRVRDSINERQEKALLRMLREGPAGFAGGLSAGNYQAITGTSPATARRDLLQLVNLGALRKTGTRKGTRYWLKLH
ncbi:MAG: Fic family protein [Fimbriimonadales bacterium]|nr:Fic family protein [Fimbriimonadales bacterium]